MRLLRVGTLRTGIFGYFTHEVAISLVVLLTVLFLALESFLVSSWLNSNRQIRALELRLCSIELSLLKCQSPYTKTLDTTGDPCQIMSVLAPHRIRFVRR